jgi:hypothetical protein
MRLVKLVLLTASSSLACSTAMAHTMWLNLVPEPVEQHVIASVAYGDFMPGSELLTPEWGNMSLVSYELISPGGQRSALGVPVLKAIPPENGGPGVTLQRGGDTGVRKIAFGAEATKGTYQIAAQSALLQYITYRNGKGEETSSDQPYAALRDVKEVVEVARDLFFMKAMYSVGGWSDPAALDQAFEIVPLADLSGLKVGDRVRFKVLLNGAAWKASGGSISAENAAFGDRWGIESTLKYSEGEFRIPAAGLWRVDAYLETRSGDFPKLIAGASPVPGIKSEDVPLHLYTSLVFHVRP